MIVLVAVRKLLFSFKEITEPQILQAEKRNHPIPVYLSSPVSLLIPVAYAAMENAIFYCCPDLVQNKPLSSSTSTRIYQY